MVRQIAITGEGIICSIGNDKKSVADSLRSQKSGIGEMRFLQSVHHELPVGEVKLSNEEMKSMLHIRKDDEISRTTLMGIIAVKEALLQAHIGKNSKKRIVLISGTTVAGMDITEQEFGDMMKNGVRKDTLKHHECGSCTADIAQYLGIFSDFTTISTACSSAINAIILGADMLKAGDADIVVAGGTESLSKLHLNGFNSLMILSHDVCRPFDKNRNGLNLGEGAAYVVMEREEDARGRDVNVDAWLTGYGNACDAFHQTASSPEDTGAQMAMRKALTMAGLKPKDINWVHAHGTGTPDNDGSEGKAILSVFGNEYPPVSSTKGLTGHTTSAAGSISAVISILAMQQGIVPGNYGLQTPMEDNIVPVKSNVVKPMDNVLCNAFGFGGNDSSIILSKNHTNGMDEEWSDGHDIEEIAKVENNSVENLKALRQYVKPMETRRMGKLMKSTLLTSLEALTEACVDMPDAIVTGTSWGCLENSEKLLVQLQEGEDLFSPTLFMQSTHNTMSSTIAIHLKCHGYNTTISQGSDSLRWSLYQAKLLLRSGRYKTVLVGCHDDSTPMFNSFFRQMGREELPEVNSVAIILKKK